MIPKILMVLLLVGHAVGTLQLAIRSRQRYRGMEKLMTPAQVFYLRYGYIWALLPVTEGIILFIGGYFS